LGGEEIQKQNTNYRCAISPEELFSIFLRYVQYKSVEDKKGILDTTGATLFLISVVLDGNIIDSYPS
jgi:hypothetical protein